jgi:hypothetical protein
MYPGLNDADIHAVQIRYEQLGRDARSIRRPLRITVPLRLPDVGRIVAVVRSAVPGIIVRLRSRPTTRHAP